MNVIWRDPEQQKTRYESLLPDLDDDLKAHVLPVIILPRHPPTGRHSWKTGLNVFLVILSAIAATLAVLELLLAE